MPDAGASRHEQGIEKSSQTLPCQSEPVKLAQGDPPAERRAQSLLARPGMLQLKCVRAFPLQAASRARKVFLLGCFRQLEQLDLTLVLDLG